MDDTELDPVTNFRVTILCYGYGPMFGEMIQVWTLLKVFLRYAHILLLQTKIIADVKGGKSIAVWCERC
jgi:hypothetical protein